MKKKLMLLVVVIVLCLSMSLVSLIGCEDKNTITYDTVGGSKIEAIKSKTIEKEPIPTKKGYTFMGWYVNKDFAGTKIAFPYTPASDVTLYALWDANKIAASDIVDIMLESLKNSLAFDGTSGFGVSLGFDIFGQTINFDANFDSENASANNMQISLAEGGKETVKISADDTFMYITTDDVKKRLKDFALGEMIASTAFGTGEKNNTNFGVAEIIFNVLFGSENSELIQSGDVSSIKADFSAISLVVEALNLSDTISGINEIVEILNQIDLILDITIKDKSFVSAELRVETKIGNVGVKLNDIKISNNFEAPVETPSKDDPSYDETNALNATFKGDVTLSDYKSGIYTPTYALNYEFRIDYNIFGALRKAISTNAEGKIAFNAMSLLDDPSNKLYLDLSHKCDGACDFCKANREGSSRGSFLTLAYSPEDFGSNNINVAVNAKHLLPKGFLNSLIDLGGIDLIKMFEEYIGIAIDPLALMINEDNYNDVAKTAKTATNSSAGVSAASDYNILGVIGDLLGFLSEIKLSDTEGLRIGTNELVEVLDNFTGAADMNLANMVSQFFGDNDYCNINVKESIFADPTTSQINIYEEYMIIDENVAGYKKFSFSGTMNTPVKNIEWLKDNNGNVKLSEATMDSSDKDGNAINLSAVEVKKLLTNGYAEYNYNLVDGTSGTASVKIHEVYGLDYTLFDTPQTVTIVTAMADAGSLSGLLNLVSGFVDGLDLNFSGSYFTTEITISSLSEEVNFYQSDSVIEEARYDKDKTYEFKDRLNPEFTVKITYKDGTSKEVKVMPNGYQEMFSNYSTLNNTQIEYYKDFVMTYSVFGEEFNLPVKVNGEKYFGKDIVVNLEPNVEYNSGYKFVTYYLEGNIEKSSTIYTAKKLSFMTAEVVEGNKDNMSFVNNFVFDKNETGTFKFTKGGVYKVNLYVGKGITQTYVFNVAEKVVIPGYDFDAKYAGNEITLDVFRTNHLGNGLNVNVVVESMVDGVATALTRGDDFELYVDINNERVKVDGSVKLNTFLIINQKIYVVVNDGILVNEDTVIKLLASDYDDMLISSDKPSNAFAGYNLSGSYVTGNYGSYIKYASTCPTDSVVAGLEYKIEVKIKLNGASDWTVLTAEQFTLGYIDDSMAFFGMIIPTPLTDPMTWFTSNGKVSVGGAMKDSCIIFDSALVANGTAGVVFEMNVYASNLNNALIASVTNA